MDPEEVKKAVSDAISISELPDKNYFDALVKKLEENLNGTISAAIENAVRPLNNKIELLERKIDVYDAHFAGLEKRLCRAEQLIDDAEQYSRRACLRIYGVPLPQSGEESNKDCLSRVKEVFKEMKVSVPADRIDRAHRIGKKSKSKGRVDQAIIVKFARWNDRTAVYKGRKNLESKVVHLDLTPRRAKLLAHARERVKEVPEIAEFAFVDVNCRVGIKTTEGEFKFFNDIEDIDAFLDDEE